MDYLVRFIVGGIILSAVSFFSTKGMPQMAGIIMTFPAITIASLLMSPADQSKLIATWGLVGVAAFTVFILVYMAFIHFNGLQAKITNIVGSAAIWIAFVGIIVYLIKK